MTHPPLVPPGAELTGEERTRYARHLLLPQFGVEAQRRLRTAQVLVVGAGGLGSPVILYLAAAGVGTITVVDDDTVDLTNLQRQVIHGTADIGEPKVESAARAAYEVNPGTEVVGLRERLAPDNVLAVVADHDIVVDGADNFETRYLVGDACARLAVPHVWGSIFRFTGQVSVWAAADGPCYRCVFPDPPPPGAVPSCAVGGVLGATAGVIGSVLAGETIKMLAGIGEPLVGRLLVHDALRQEWGEVPVRRHPACPVCSPDADLRRPVGIADACAPASAPDDAVPEVTVRDLAHRLAARESGGDDFVLVDVREPGERAVVVIPGADPVPLDVLRAGEEPVWGGRTVLVHCKSGGRSAEAVRLLRGRGVDAHNVTGGVLAWVAEVDPSLPAY